MKACRQERGWRGVLTGHLDNQEKIKENQGSLPERSKKKFLSLILAVLCFCLTACQAQSGGAEQILWKSLDKRLAGFLLEEAALDTSGGCSGWR